MARVKKIDAPIFVIGLGGTGFDVLMRVKSEFSKRFITERLADGSYTDCPERTEFLEIDTDPSVGRQYKYGMRLKPTEFCNIEGDVAAAHALLQGKTYVSEWVDNRIAAMGIAHNGAGQVRQVGRLFLFNGFNAIRSKIEGKLAALARVSAGAADRTKKIEVKIMSGICGGTGSGTLLDIAYIIKDIARERGYSINMEAFLFMPDTTVEFMAGDSEPLIRSLHTNSYALLKELDYWMNAGENGIEFTQQYTDSKSIKWEGAPFDNVYLQCARNENGVNIADAYWHNVEVISEYLVHCYEGDADGNENMSVMNEKDGGATTNSNSFSFQSARSNQDAIVNNINQPYPVPYCYHSLGAFSNAGEDRLMELTEWNMIYKETVNRFDTRVVHMDGAAPEDFIRATMSFEDIRPTPAGGIRRDYNERHSLPDLDADFPMGNVFNQTSEAAPHGDLYTGTETLLNQTYGDEKVRLCNEVWRVFLDEARRIGGDVSKGPKYLLDLLNNGANSLQMRLPSYMARIDTLCRAAGDTKESKLKQAKGTFQAFVDHRILGARIATGGRYNSYMADVRELYESSRNHAYFKALHFALTEFNNRLQLYIAVLTDLVTAIRKHQQDTELELGRVNVNAALFDIERMNESLTDLFAADVARDKAVHGLYEGVLNITERCMESSVPAERLPGMVDAAIDSLRENMFAAVGSMSITQKITAYMGVLSGPAMQDHVADNLAPRFESGASVMFSPSAGAGALTGDKAARTSVISVPQNENDIANGITAYCMRHNMTVILKRAPSSDRIFWVNDKGGMPLYFYSGMEQLRDHYAAQRDIQNGYHLFMANTHGLIHDPIKQNWLDVIPDPVICRQNREIGEKAELLKKAEQEGALKISYTFPQDGTNRPSANITMEKLRKINGVDASDYTVTQAIGELPTIDAEVKLTMAKDIPAIEAKIAALQQRRDEIAELLKQPQVVAISIHHLADKANEWGNTLGNFNDLIALNGATMNDQELEAMRNEWEKAFERAIREALALRPILLDTLKAQSDCRAKVNDALASLDEMIAKLEAHREGISGKFDVQKVVAFAPTLAKLMMYDRVRLLPAKANAFPDAMDDPKTLFTLDTETAGLASAFEKYRQFPMAVRLAAYLSHEGANSQILAEAITASKAMAKRVQNAEDVTKDVKACFKAAKKISAMLKKNEKSAKNAMFDEEIEKADFDFCSAVLTAMTNELKQFINAWDPYMPEDEDE